MHYPIVSNYMHFLFNLLLSINQEFKMLAPSTQPKGVISIIRILPTDHSDAWRGKFICGKLVIRLFMVTLVTLKNLMFIN